MEREKKIELRTLMKHGGQLTNYQGYTSFLRRVGVQQEKQFYRSKLLSSIQNKAPNIVLDFQFQNDMKKISIIKSLYRQIIEIIHLNRHFPEPFQMHFCNYDYESTLNREFG